MKTTAKLYRQNDGADMETRKKVGNVLNNINRKILDNIDCGFTRFDRGHDETYLHVSLSALAQAKKLIAAE